MNLVRTELRVRKENLVRRDQLDLKEMGETWETRERRDPLEVKEILARKEMLVTKATREQLGNPVRKGAKDSQEVPDSRDRREELVILVKTVIRVMMVTLVQ